MLKAKSATFDQRIRLLVFEGALSYFLVEYQSEMLKSVNLPGSKSSFVVAT